jgi:hypothetical protein
MKRLLFALCLLFGFASFAYAAPITTFQNNLLPNINDKFDLGSTTPALEWLHGYFNTVCIQGDCRTVWPTGGGGSVGNWFTPTSYGNSTSTTLGFLNGLISNGSTTITGLTSGVVVNNNGKLFSTASSSLNLPNTALQNSSITVNSVAVSLGSSITVASTTLLGDSNTLSGTLVTFSNAPKLASLSGLIAGNSGQTYGVSTTSMSASITGNAGTATALAANGTNCSAGFYPLGVDASGNIESCTFAFATTSPFAVDQIQFINHNGVGITLASSSLNLPNSALTNSSITVNGTGVSLGGSITVSSTTLLANFNTFTGGNIFGNATSSVAAFTTLASTTQLVLGNITGTQCLHVTSNGVVSGIGSDCAAGFAWPWTANAATVFFGQASNSTTTQMHFGAVGTSLSASSTAAFDQLTIGSTTVGNLSTSTVNGNFILKGETLTQDIANNWQGQNTPTRNLTFQAGTTTVWSGTTTSAYGLTTVARYAGTIRDFSCDTDSFLGVELDVNSTAVAPAYVVASSTNGLITLTGSNTFVKGDKIKIKFGTTTTAATPAATYATCTLNVTQTP